MFAKILIANRGEIACRVVRIARRMGIATVAIALNGCSTLPPTHDPEGCDRIDENAKQAGSDLVADGDLVCAADDGDCVLTPRKIVVSRLPATSLGDHLPVHILRAEADAYDRELKARNAIAFCFPAELWYPSAGTYRGRFYLREVNSRLQMAFYPRQIEVR